MPGLTFSDSVSALQANSQATGAVSDGIANAQTHGYKENNGYFSTLVTGTSDSFAAGGVLSRIVQNVSAQGVLETSNSATHLAIAGNGFFVGSTNASVKDIQYTRAGHFFPDKTGNLQNVNGLFLQGWATDETGAIPAGTTTSDLSSLETINVSKVSGLSNPTSTIKLQANLPSTDAVNDTRQTNIPIYDSLGARHTLTVTWTKTTVTPCTWTAAITCPDAATITKSTDGNPYSGGTALAVVFDGYGKPQTFDGGAVVPGIQITWNNALTNAANQNITLNLGTIGDADGVTSRAGEYSAPTIQQDGREFGTFRSVSINEEGLVSAIYSNGQELKIAQVAMANFAAPDRLESLSGNSWIQTDESGTYVLGLPTSGGMGKIQSYSLEKSTVDIAEKMTDLIELQNHYVSNTKSIATKKDMFAALMAIK